MDSSGFRPSLNVQDRRGERGTNALLFAALQDKLMDPSTPEHERAAIHRRLSGLISYEWHPDSGFQGGEPAHNELGRGLRHIGQAPTQAETPLGFGILGEFSDLVQRPGLYERPGLFGRY